MATLQSGKCFTVPTFFGMCCRSEWQERMYIYKWHEVDQTKHEIFCVHIVCNEIQVKVNLEINTFFFYLRFPYCPNFFWFGVVYIYIYIYIHTHTQCPPLILAPLINISKGGCENKSALFILFIFHSKKFTKFQPITEVKIESGGEISLWNKWFL